LSSNFDQYKEEINDQVSYGLLYTHRVMSDRFTNDGSINDNDMFAYLRKKAIEDIIVELKEEYDTIVSTYKFKEIKDA
jgi:hypothetical protein